MRVRVRRTGGAGAGVAKAGGAGAMARRRSSSGVSSLGGGAPPPLRQLRRWEAGSGGREAGSSERQRRWPVDGLGGPLGGLAVFVHGFSFFLFLFDLPRGGHLALLGK